MSDRRATYGRDWESHTVTITLRTLSQDQLSDDLTTSVTGTDPSFVKLNRWLAKTCEFQKFRFNTKDITSYQIKAT